MIDLNSPKIQASFKRTKLVTMITRFIMGLLTILSGALAIWMASRALQVKMDWSVTTYIVILSVACVCFIGLFLWTAITNAPYSATLHGFVAETFYSKSAFLKVADALIQSGLKPEFTFMLIGDKLNVFLSGTEDVVQLDLYPIKNYYSACAATVKYAKHFILSYCAVSALDYGSGEIIITDSVTGRSRESEYIVAADGELNPFIRRGYFIKRGIVKI